MVFPHCQPQTSLVYARLLPVSNLLLHLDRRKDELFISHRQLHPIAFLQKHSRTAIMELQPKI